MCICRCIGVVFFGFVGPADCFRNVLTQIDDGSGWNWFFIFLIDALISVAGKCLLIKTEQKWKSRRVDDVTVADWSETYAVMWHNFFFKRTLNLLFEIASRQFSIAFRIWEDVTASWIGVSVAVEVRMHLRWVGANLMVAEGRPLDASRISVSLSLSDDSMAADVMEFERLRFMRASAWPSSSSSASKMMNEKNKQQQLDSVYANNFLPIIKFEFHLAWKSHVFFDWRWCETTEGFLRNHRHYFHLANCDLKIER